MSAELVINKLTGKARMILRTQGWHALANVAADISLAMVHETLGTDTKVEVFPLTYPDGTVSTFSKGVRWEGFEMGTVGPTWEPLQNRAFVDSFAPWLDTGMATIEGAGLLRGGAIAFVQLNPQALDPIEIRPGDAVRSRVFGVNGHDGKTGIRLGQCDERIVCANTLGVALREVAADEKAGKTNGFRAKHVGNVEFKVADIQAQLMAIRANLTKSAEAFKFLDSKAVKDAATCYKFSRLLAGKSDVLGADYKPSKVDLEIETLFRHGKGNLGRSFWDLLNAATERHTHGEGNDLKADAPGDKEARRLDALWFGTLATANARALNVAMKMANAA
jgi:hypothetical protein